MIKCTDHSTGTSYLSVSHSTYLKEVTQSYSEIRGKLLKYKSKPSSLSLFAKNPIIYMYHLCQKKNTKEKYRKENKKNNLILFTPNDTLSALQSMGLWLPVRVKD